MSGRVCGQCKYWYELESSPRYGHCRLLSARYQAKDWKRSELVHITLSEASDIDVEGVFPEISIETREDFGCTLFEGDTQQSLDKRVNAKFDRIVKEIP